MVENSEVFDDSLIPSNFEDMPFENVVPQFDICGSSMDPTQTEDLTEEKKFCQSCDCNHNNESCSKPKQQIQTP